MVKKHLYIEDIQRISFKQQLFQSLCIPRDGLLTKQINQQSFSEFEVCLQKISHEPQGSFRSGLIRTWLAEARMEKLALPEFKENVVAAAAEKKPFKKKDSLLTWQFLGLSQYKTKDIDEKELEVLFSLLEGPVHLHSNFQLRNFLLDNESQCRLYSDWQHHTQSCARYSCVFSNLRLSSEFLSAFFKQSRQSFIRLQFSYDSKSSPAHSKASIFANLKESISNSHTALPVFSHSLFIEQVEKSKHSQKFVEKLVSKQFFQVVAFTWLRQDTLHELQEVIVEVQRMLAEVKAIYQFQGKCHQIAAQLAVVVNLCKDGNQ